MVNSLEKSNGFGLKPINKFRALKTSEKPIYQFDKHNKEFVRVYYVQSVDKGEVKLGFNEFFMFVANGCNFDFDRIHYRYVDSKTFKADQTKYTMYY